MLPAPILGITMGIPMGLSFAYSGIYKPSTIRSQLEMRDWSMVKTFLSAVSVSGLSTVLMTTSSNFILQSKPFHTIFTPIGGGLLGIGMYLVGSCPGTVWAQLGAGIEDSIYITIGGFIGSLTYAAIAKYLPSYSSGLFLHSDILQMSYNKVALPFFGSILLSLLAIEIYQYKKYNKKINWNLYIAGTVIGLLQIPSIGFINSGIGASSASLTIPATILRALNITNPTLVKFTSFTKNYWQVGFDIGISLGSFIYLKNKRSLKEKRKECISNGKIIKNLFGGFVLCFGARLAGGCTSGHGLTGVSNLSVTSFIAVISMFTTGFLSGKIKSNY